MHGVVVEGLSFAISEPRGWFPFRDTSDYCSCQVVMDRLGRDCIHGWRRQRIRSQVYTCPSSFYLVRVVFSYIRLSWRIIQLIDHNRPSLPVDPRIPEDSITRPSMRNEIVYIVQYT